MTGSVLFAFLVIVLAMGGLVGAETCKSVRNYFMSRKTIAERDRQKQVRAIHGREFVELLDKLIWHRIVFEKSPLQEEAAELIKRDMADYLNDIDQTGGLQVK